MTIRFAAPRSSIRNRMDEVEVHQAIALPANDNGTRHASETMLHAALRHFAQHGLAAANHASKQAQDARDAGDEQAYAWWLDICRALDRRMAGRLEKGDASDLQIKAN
ncbi:hypothetical protein GCM10009127_16300 [Alteraurantiacibacter aestuarii]|uniref:Uncharacterized protein n=1 Tax=Alteraurantiacibacter aestuarii TaxID=650004 RepID=A0A844ZJP2_9SPHN|nr:hypothetical protein [Alteraurantiacibacter aestuarii]MXO87784.1 hypothetical protein [Alteraurantiacibacter aestuarii]